MESQFQNPEFRNNPENFHPCLTHFILGHFFMFFCRLLIFFKSSFSKNSYKNTIRVSNSLGPDQAQHFVGPDLGPNCLQFFFKITFFKKFFQEYHQSVK